MEEKGEELCQCTVKRAQYSLFCPTQNNNGVTPRLVVYWWRYRPSARLQANTTLSIPLASGRTNEHVAELPPTTHPAEPNATTGACHNMMDVAIE